MITVEERKQSGNFGFVDSSVGSCGEGSFSFDVLVKLFSLKYGEEAISNSLVLAKRLGLDFRVSVEYEVKLEEWLRCKLGVVDSESIHNVCPGCLGVLDSAGLPVLVRDAVTGEVACRNCGYSVFDCASAGGDLSEADDSKPFGEEWKPSSNMSVGGSKGGTLNAFDYRSRCWSGEKGLAAVLGSSGSLSYVDLKDFSLKYPDLAKALVGGVPYVFADGYVFRLRVYQRGPRAGLQVVDRVALKDFEASGKSAFDCMKVRGQRLQSMLGVELPGQDALLIMATKLANRYGIGFGDADKVFMDTFGSYIRSAFAICNDYGVAYRNQVLVHTMFYRTLKDFDRRLLLNRCRSELSIDWGLYEVVLSIRHWIKTVLNAKGLAKKSA